MKTTPILLADDDGLRLVQSGQTRTGSYRFHHFHNPQLIADLVAIRRHREIIRSVNERLVA